jgi:hypothetical protein
MKNNITTILEKAIGEDKVENITSETESEYSYQKRNNQCIGYNLAKAELRAKIPAIQEAIVREIRNKADTLNEYSNLVDIREIINHLTK